MASRLGALVNVYGIVNSAKYQDTFFHPKPGHLVLKVAGVPIFTQNIAINKEITTGIEIGVFQWPFH